MASRNPWDDFRDRHSPREAPLSAAEDKLLTETRFKSKFVDKLNNERPDLAWFKVENNGPYADAAVETDMAYVKKLKKEKFTKDKHDRAFLAETLLFYAIDQEKLLGDQVETLATSEYDDFTNGTDFVLEIRHSGGVAYLAIDATAAENPDIIASKRQKIMDELRAGRVTGLKYFQSEPKIFGFHAMPKAVLSINHAELKELAKGLVEGTLDKKALNKTLLQQIENQLITGLKEIEKTPHDKRLPVQVHYHALLEALQSIKPSS